MIGVIVLTVSCESDDVTFRLVDFDKFTIEIPETWTPVEQQGYDSFVGQIDINDKEKIIFDLGRYSSKLAVSSSTHDIGITIIDDKPARVVKPKGFGKGTTGVYFDSLEVTKATKFQLSGSDLSPDNQRLLLIAIESLRFKN